VDPIEACDEAGSVATTNVTDESHASESENLSDERVADRSESALKWRKTLTFKSGFWGVKKRHFGAQKWLFAC